MRQEIKRMHLQKAGKILTGFSRKFEEEEDGTQESFDSR
jgi:hypothetical protein